MSSIPADLRYTTDHEYIKATSDAGVFAVGITDYAQGELGDQHAGVVEPPHHGGQHRRIGHRAVTIVLLTSGAASVNPVTMEMTAGRSTG